MYLLKRYTIKYGGRKFSSISTSYDCNTFVIGFNGHYGVEVWSEAIDISAVSVPKLVHIPDVCEAKISLKSVGLNILLYIEPMDRAQVCMFILIRLFVHFIPSHWLAIIACYIYNLQVAAKEVQTKTGDIYYMASMNTEQNESASEDLLPATDDEQKLSVTSELTVTAHLITDKVRFYKIIQKCCYLASCNLIIS